MTKTEQKIIELETEVKMLRECLVYERSKPTEVKYYPTPNWPNTFGRGPANGPFPGLNTSPHIGINWVYTGDSVSGSSEPSITCLTGGKVSGD